MTELKTHISDFGATNFASYLSLLTMKMLKGGGGADKNIFTRKGSWYFTKTKMSSMVFSFFAAKYFFL